MAPKTTSIVKLQETAKQRGLDPCTIPAFGAAQKALEEQRFGDYKRIVGNIRSFVSGSEERST